MEVVEYTEYTEEYHGHRWVVCSAESGLHKHAHVLSGLCESPRKLYVGEEIHEHQWEDEYVNVDAVVCSAMGKAHGERGHERTPGCVKARNLYLKIRTCNGCETTEAA